MMRPPMRPMRCTFSIGLRGGAWNSSRKDPKGNEKRSNKKLLVTRASLLGARTLLVAPGLTTSNKKLLVTRMKQEFRLL